MRGQRTTSPLVRWVVSVTALLLVGYLAALALRPSIVDALPAWLAWFGRPGSMSTLAIVVTVLIVACVLTFRSNASHRVVGVSFTVTPLHTTRRAGRASACYGGCHDANHPPFFRPLRARPGWV